MKLSYTLAASLLSLLSPSPSSASPIMSRACKATNSSTSPARLLLSHTGAIYMADFDGESFTTTLNQSVSGDPSWMLPSPDNSLLYAVDEWSSTMRVFNLDVSGASIGDAPVAQAQGSSGVVHLAFNSDNTVMLGAGYGAGTIDVWDVSAKDQIKLIKTIQPGGDLGPDKDRQAANHPHQVVLDPSGRYFAVNDLGTDSIVLVDSKDDAWTVVDHVPVPAGAGPRHGGFVRSADDETKAAYYAVVCEMGNIVVFYSVSYNADGEMSMEQVQSISSFGNDADEADGAAGGELVVAANGVDVYASNRIVTGTTGGSIAHFKVQDGQLAFQKLTDCGGALPRMFSLGSGNQDVLYVGNQKGDGAVTALKRNKDGSLVETPMATMGPEEFGKEGDGPQFVMQVA